MLGLLMSAMLVLSAFSNYVYIPNSNDLFAYEESKVAEAVNAYEKYVEESSGMQESFTFSLIYVDDNEIPELVAYGDCEAFGTKICTYYQGEVHEQQFSRLGYTYLEKENLICNDAGHMGVYYDYVFTIENGEFVLIAKGDYVEDYGKYTEMPDKPVFDYSWDDVSVSEEEYFENLEAVYDETNAVYALEYYETVRDAYLNLETHSDAVSRAYAGAESETLEALEAYEKYVENNPGVIFELLYIDDDNVPEMFVHNIKDTTCRLCCYNDGKIIENDMGYYLLQYIEKGNIFYMTEGMENDSLIYYMLSDGKIIEIPEDEADIYGNVKYAWGYYRSVKEAFLRLDMKQEN